MLPIMYEIPSMENLKSVTITAETLDGKKPELVFEEKPVLEAVRKNPTISNFWKAFAEKYLCKLRIYDETNVNDSNSCGRTFENCSGAAFAGGRNHVRASENA